MSDVIELFGRSTANLRRRWSKIADGQWCPYLKRTCIKVRKSQPEISIGTCSVFYGKTRRPIIICPFRLLERRQIFTDCLHLLPTHEPGNELHIVSEISVPGGSVDYFIASVRDGKVKDFVGIELQTLDTTGTVWPARQEFLKKVNVVTTGSPTHKTYGMNWKMTAKTILIQLHHKIRTFEAINKHLTLVVQDCLLDYLRQQFQFSHLRNARRGDPMQIHAYRMSEQANKLQRLELTERLSTDSDGIAICLGLQAEIKIELEQIVTRIESKLSSKTRFEL
ncbi:MAG: NotI family restriction endonuclease [Planctomycetota bacterium]|jgi:hypothetical protein